MFKFNTTDKKVAQASFSSDNVVSPNVFENDYTFSADIFRPALDDVIPTTDVGINRILRNIYRFDYIAGSAIDLMSNLPFSKFTLGGVKDTAELQIFQDCIDQLNTTALLPEIAVEYLALGKVIGTLVFNDTKGIFTDLIIQDINETHITPIPLYGYDPKIDLNINKNFKTFLRSQDPRDIKAKKELSPELVTRLLNNTRLPLEPENTIYLARKTFPTDLGTSFLIRILPFYALEQALTQGTISGALRRQRAIMHITAGDEDWEPTPDELTALVELFMRADQDPIGAIIATRSGIQIEDVRSGSDFWKVTDELDTLSGAKMRALGINESFLTGDATYNTMETALSVFIEQLKAFREFVTNAVFYRKIFPTLARVHKMVKRTEAELSHNIRITGTGDNISIKDLVIPDITYHKQLTPQYDSNYLDILSTIKDQGVPIPIRTWAAAGGMDITKVLSGLDEDVATRKKIEKYDKELPEGAESSYKSLSSKPKVRDSKKLKMVSKKINAKKVDDLIKKVPKFGESYGLVGKYNV